MNKKLLGYAVLIIVIVGGGFIWARNTNNGSATTNESATNQSAEANAEAKQVIYYEGVEGQTALALLQSTHSVELKHYDFGDMVVSIDGRAATDGVNFWEFLVNGLQTTEGAGTYMTKAGEQISWQLTTINAE